MPTIFTWNGYRFYFYSHEPFEPPHVHIDKAGHSAKFWLKPVALASHHGFRDNTLRELERKVRAEHAALLKAWHGYFKH